MKKELKKCPFCGNVAIGWCDGKEDETCQYLYTVECTNCGANIGWHSTAIKAGKSWNMRKQNE